MSSTNLKENFFPLIIQKQIYNLLSNNNFCWNFREKLDKDRFASVKDILLKDPNIILEHGLQHTFYNPSGGITEDYKKYKIDLIDLFKTYVEKEFHVKINEVLRLMAVLTLPNTAYKDNYLMPHVDWLTDHFTLIYYVNDTDGDTIIFNEKVQYELDSQHVRAKNYYAFESNLNKKTINKRITPKQGSALLIDGLTYHSGSVPSVNPRYVINFNFRL